MDRVYSFVNYDFEGNKIKSYQTLTEAYNNVDEYPQTEYIMMAEYNLKTETEERFEEVWRRK